MRVGLFGGSFNPPHAGHAHVAQTALRRVGLQRIVWLVSPQNPLKTSPSPLETRMARAGAFARGPAMTVSDAESRLGVRYSIDTVRLLKARYPGVRFVWVMGADSLASFHRWKGWTQIFAELPVVVIARPHMTMKALASPAARRFAHARLPASAARLLPLKKAPAWTYLSGPLDFTSSTALREREKPSSR